MVLRMPRGRLAQCRSTKDTARRRHSKGIARASAIVKPDLRTAFYAPQVEVGPPSVSDEDLLSQHFERAIRALQPPREVPAGHELQLLQQQEEEEADIELWLHDTSHVTQLSGREVQSALRGLQQVNAAPLPARADAAVARIESLLHRACSLDVRTVLPCLRHVAGTLAQSPSLTAALQAAPSAQVAIRQALDAAAGDSTVYVDSHSVQRLAQLQLDLRCGSDVFWQALARQGLQRYSWLTVGLLVHCAAALAQQGLITPPQPALLHAFDAAITHHAPAMNLHAVSNCWWAFAKLKTQHSAAAQDVLLSRTAQLLATEGGAAVANAVYALAQSHSPGVAQLSWPVHAAVARTARSMTGQQLALCTLGLGRLSKQRCRTTLSTALLAAIEKGATALEAADLARIMWGLAQRRAPLPRQLRSALAVAVERTARQCSAEDAACIAWAFARLGAEQLQQPPPVLLTVIAGQSRAMSARNLSMTLWALATLRPPHVQVARAFLLPALEHQLRRMNVRELVTTQWALLALEWQPGAVAAAQLQQKLLRCASDFSAQDTAMLAHVLALQERGSDSPLWPAVAAAIDRTAARMSAQAVANTLWAVSVLQPEGADRVVLQALQRALARTAMAMHVPEVAMVWCALAHLRHSVNRSPADAMCWVGALLQVTQREAACMQPRDVANIMWAIAKMKLPVGHATLQALFAALDATAGEMGAQDVAHALWAIATWRLPCGGERAATLRSLGAAAARTAPSMGTLDLTQVLWALATLSTAAGAHALAPRLRAALGATVVRTIVDAPAAQVATIVRAMACLRLQFEGALQERSLAAVERCVPGFNDWEVLQIVDALHELHAQLSPALYGQLVGAVRHRVRPGPERDEALTTLTEGCFSIAHAPTRAERAAHACWHGKRWPAG